jgi:RNA polymerase sigma-70 factor, ECF subfamily
MSDSVRIAMPAAAPVLASSSWSLLVERVRNADPFALQELYDLFSRGIRYYLWRHLGPQDLDDRVHDAFLAVTESIQNGELRHPECLLGFVRTVVRRQVATQIETAVNSRRNRFSHDMLATLHDHRIGPEEAAIQREYQEVAMRLLGSIPERDREVLIRFYLKEQTVGQICSDLDLTDTQFRLIKSRAKARFGKLGKARLAQRSGFLPKRK